MGFVQISVIFFIATLLLLGGTRGFLWGHLRHRRLGVPSLEPVDREALPRTLDPIFEAAERHLLPMGFEPAGARWIGSIDRCEGTRPEAVFQHREAGALAFVGPPLPGMGDRPYRVSFVSRLAGGLVVATFDGLAHLTPRFPSAWECHDHDLNDLGRQWAAHLQALDPHGGLDAIAPLSVESWNALERATLAETLEEWARDGLTRRARDLDGERVWQFRARPAWALASTLLAGQKRVLGREAETARLRARRELWRSSVDVVTDPLEPALERARAASMAWGYEYTRNANRRRAASHSPTAKWLTGIASGGACLYVFGLWFGWELAVLLGGVLLLHELGHVMGMAAFGYRDRRILFLPLFGAAALGDKPDATPTQRTVVLLLGPIPGLLLGLFCLYVFFQVGGLWWLALATTALIVNYFNLLPISPLDGGRIVETLLLGRYPRAQVVFLAGGTLTLAFSAWLFRDPILAAMALALVISLRSAWAAASGLVRVRERIDDSMSRAERVQAVFETLQEAPFGETPVSQRVRLAGIIEPRLRAPLVRPRAAVAGALVYLALLAGVPAAVAGSVYAFQPRLWDLVVSESRIGGDRTATVERVRVTPQPRGRRAAQSSSVTITEASLVGR